MNNATQIVEPNNTDDRSLASRYPQLSLQWHPILNGTLIPNDVTATNHRRVWWQYEKGHAWMAPVYSHVTGCGCPVCANKMILTEYSVLAAKYPELTWHPTKNGDITPQVISYRYD